MPVESRESSQPPRRAGDTQRHVSYRPVEPAARSGMRYAVVLALLIILIALCLAAFVLARVYLYEPGSNASPGPATEAVSGAPTTPSTPPAQPGDGQNQGQITIQPAQGYINTLVTVMGEGWWPGEPVFVFLRAPGEEDRPGYAYAAAVADDLGEFRAAFTFPNEVRWLGGEWAEVIARGTRSEFEASTRFTLIAPTATATSPPPTAPATLAPTMTPPPTNTPLPTPTAAPPVISDWLGEYYDNLALAGDPVLRRNDVAIDFSWGAAAPGEGMPADRFSVRWTRPQHFRAGTYRFTVAADDGVRFWIDGQLYVDDWQDGPLRPHSFDLSLARGEHAFRVEYYENLGEAGIQLEWEKAELPTATPSATLPAASVTPTATPESTGTPAATPTSPPPLTDAWLAQYYANASLNGDPALVRDDAELDFDWGLGSPGEGIPRNNFSARWTRDIWFPSGTYRFFLEVDDGARFWVDGDLLIDTWTLATYRTHTAEVALSAGIHTMKVEYFEALVEASIRLWVEKVPAAMSLHGLPDPPEPRPPSADSVGCLSLSESGSESDAAALNTRQHQRQFCISADSCYNLELCQSPVPPRAACTPSCMGVCKASTFATIPNVVQPNWT